MNNSLFAEEAFALLHAIDHLPAGDDLRTHYVKAVERTLGASWLGRKRVYMAKCRWGVVESGPDMGCWVAHNGKRVRLGDDRLNFVESCGHVTLISEGNFADVVYVVSTTYRFEDGVMRLPVGETPAEFTSAVYL